MNIFPRQQRFWEIIYNCILISPLFTIYIYSDNLVNGRYTLKYFYFVMTGIVIISLVSIITLFKNKAITISNIDCLIIIFYLYLFVRMVFTSNVPLENTRFITYTVLLVLYFIWKNQFKNNHFYQVYMFGLLMVASGQAIYGLMQFYHIIPLPPTIGLFKVTGNFGNPSPYASFLGPLVPLSLGIYLLTDTSAPLRDEIKNISFITFLLLVLILPATHSRASWIAAGITSLLILNRKWNVIFRLKDMIHSRFYRISLIVLLLLIFSAGAVSLYHFKKDSALGRLIQWKISTQLIAEKPVFGHGYNQFERIYNDRQAEYFSTGKRSEQEKRIASYTIHAHNDYLELWTETGFIGLLLFLAIVSFALIKTKNTNLNYTMKVALLAFLIEALFTFPFHILPQLIVFTSMLAFIGSNLKSERIMSYPKVLSVAGLLFVSICAGRQANNYNAHKIWHQANMLSSGQVYEAADKLYESLYPVLKSNGAYLLNYGGTLTLKKQYNKAIPILQNALLFSNDPNIHLSLGNCYLESGDYRQAEKYYQKAEAIEPYKFYPKYLLVKLYAKTADEEKLCRKCKEILAMNIKVHSTAVDQIKKDVMTLTGGCREPGGVNESVNKKRKEKP